MKLQNKPFHTIRDGSKVIEVRLNDEKRKLIREGDEIVFTLHDNLSEELHCTVIERLEYETFFELFDAFPLEMFGGNNKEISVLHSRG